MAERSSRLVEIVLSLVDKTTNTAKKVSESVGDVGKKFLDAGTKITGFQKLVAGVTLGGIAVKIKQFADEVDALNKKARQLDITVEGLQRLQYAASLTATDGAEKMSGALEKMVRRLAMAERGLGPANKAIGELNINLATVNKLDTEAKFYAIVTALNQVEDASARAALQAEIFGINSAELNNLLNKSADEIRQYATEAKNIISADQAAQAERFNDSLTRINDTLGQMSTRAIPPVLEYLNNLMQDRLDIWDPQDIVAVEHEIETFTEKLATAQRQVELYNKKSLAGKQAAKDVEYYTFRIEGLTSHLKQLNVEAEKTKQKNKELGHSVVDLANDWKTLGIDLNKVRTGVTSTEASLIEAFKNIATSGEASFDEMQAAFDATLRNMRSSSALSALATAMANVYSQGAITAGQYKKALEDIALAQQKIKDQLNKADSPVDDKAVDKGTKSLQTLANEAAIVRRQLDQGIITEEQAQPAFDAISAGYRKILGEGEDTANGLYASMKATLDKLAALAQTKPMPIGLDVDETPLEELSKTGIVVPVRFSIIDGIPTYSDNSNEVARAAAKTGYKL